MKLRSLIQNSNKLEVAEVEIEFIPGIPQIHFLGLPDRIIKESFYRIKSALRSAGYKFPLTSQIIVNIKPNHLRKSSRGVELAVALGILLKTGQVESSLFNPSWVIYGELGLDGSVFAPGDLDSNLFNFTELAVLTGQIDRTTSTSQESIHGARLKHLSRIEFEFENHKMSFVRPIFGLEKNFNSEEAEFIFLAATSELHGLLAGDSGAGKSTLARSYLSFLSEPQPEEFVRFDENWRPFVSPHQSITPAAFLGGGSQLYEGELERAQGGVLMLDELLEFDPEILEALRGPMTGDILRMARASQVRSMVSNFQVLATSNLCPCGKWTPLKSSISCRFSRTKCTRYLERLSGPLLDRFGLLLFTTKNSLRAISGYKILNRIERIKKRLERVGEIYGQSLDYPASKSEILEVYYKDQSTRRKKYLLKVANIYAIEQLAEEEFEELFNQSNPSSDCIKNQLKIDLNHFNLAEKWVIKPFEQLEKGMD
jgi:magnesium chelatase family protein